MSENLFFENVKFDKNYYLVNLKKNTNFYDLELFTQNSQVNPPVIPPVNPPVIPPVNPPVNPPVIPPVNPPVILPVNPPVIPPVIPPVNSGPTDITKLTSWFTEEIFEMIYPYSKASAAFTHDNAPFWRYNDLIEAIKYMNKHPNSLYHGFGTANPDNKINMFEIAAFLGNMHQEVGEPSITAPYPWAWPNIPKTGAVYEGPAGGCLGILEGAIAEVYFSNDPTVPDSVKQGQPELFSNPQLLSSTEKKVLGVSENYIGGIVRNLIQLNQPQFGLPNAGVVFQDNLVGVSQDGTLYGDNPTNNKVGTVLPVSQLKRISGDPKYNALSPISQYGGRGAIQLSYNYNYTDCSLDLFGDYRLIKYPNLIITTDRITFMNNVNSLKTSIPKSFYFGFPGNDINGNNPLPENILNTTPPARQLAIITCLWFWMSNNRSGRNISCHDCMQQPYTIGICGTNLIINNQDGLSKGTWAANKNDYYRRICRIINLLDYELTIVKPPRELYNR